MTRMWDVMYFGWLAWCLAAYGSELLAPSLAGTLASPIAAVIAGVVGVVLGWRMWVQQRAALPARRWLRLQEWPRATWAAVVVGVLWLGLSGLNVRDGRVGSVFGLYLVLMILVGFLPLMLSETEANTASERPE